MRQSFAFNLCLLVLLGLVGCSSGGGGGGGSSGTGSYSVDLSVSEVTIDITYGLYEENGRATVGIRYKGAGLVAGFPAGELEDSSMTLDFENVTASTATLVIGYSLGSQISPPGLYTRKVRVLTGNESGSQYTYKDLIVNLRQLDGIAFDDSGATADGSSSGGDVLVSSFGMTWQASTENAWIQLQQTSGIGEQNLVFTYDYSQAQPGVNTGAIRIEASDGGNTVIRNYPVTLDNNLAVVLSSNSFYNRWGEVIGPFNLDITTRLSDWQLSSDQEGVTFTPSSGSGNASVLVTVDSSKLLIGDNTVALVVGSQDLSASGTMTVNLILPEFYDHPNGPETYLHLVKNIFDTEANGVVNFALTTGAVGNWQVQSLPSWLTANAMSGSTAEPLELFVNDNAPVEGDVEADFNVAVTVPGASIDFAVHASARVEQYTLEPKRFSYAFSDYVEDSVKGATITLRGISKFSELHMQGALQSTSSADWLVVDSSLWSGVSFHLETSGLAEGYHIASLTLSDPNREIIKPATVNIGYYKSNAPAAPASSNIDIIMRGGLRDPLGPWTYFTKDGFTDVLVWNNVSGEFEAPISFNTASSLNLVQITDDGQYLIAHDYLNTRYYFYNLLTKEHVTYWDAFSNASEFHWLRVDGVPVIYTSSNWYDFATFERLESSFLGDYFSLEHYVHRIGDGILNGSPFNCGITYSSLSYAPLYFSDSRAMITLGDPSPTIGGCSNLPFEFSADQQLFVYYNSNNKTVNKATLTSNISIEILQSITLADDLDLIGMAITSSGRIVIATRALNGINAIRIYNSDMTDFELIEIEDGFNVLGTAGIVLSSDEKTVSYLETDLNYETARVVTFPIQ